MTDVAEALRTTRPQKVTVLLDDDREVALAIPRGTAKWQRLAATIAGQAWVEVRMFNKEKELKATLTRDEPTSTSGTRTMAGDLEDLAAKEVMVPVSVVRLLFRETLHEAMHTFTEVAKVMRSSGSAEVTAALTANRETVGASHAMLADMRDQLDAERAKVRELETELAARLAAGDPEKKPSAAERLFESFAGGMMAGATDGGKGAGSAADPQNGKAA